MTAIKSDRGSVSVEAVGSIVTLSLFGAVFLQLLLVMNAYLMLGHATREGARAAALGQGDTAVIYLVANIAGLEPTTADIDISPSERDAGDLVSVSAVGSVTRLPVLSALLPDLQVSMSATARAEVDHR